ncbi:ABC-type transport auxiliary lipoprotein family protein [Novosphingobium clariflavum]|uniref:ABC-type transport auxiliary lipoprotein family protein n=1 Tax=Novosphingobium clariflavum TaxID=2029884 RepID=A0ABV6S8W0_9SPHN|nr:ABC-type transport auxiliary lipoprotein family protein [Novosphingobium clariflavum]
MKRLEMRTAKMIGNTVPGMKAATGALLLTACLALPGCISLAAKPPEQLIRLTSEETAPAGAQVSSQLADAIVVADPEADRSLDVLRVPVKVDASGLSYLKDAVWTEKPTRQMRTLLAETLRARTGKLVVEGIGYEVSGKTLIGGRLLDMGYDAPTRSVVVRFDAIRTERGGPITTRRFEARVADVKPEASKVGPALNQAANDVARQVADWVKAQ